MRRSCRLVKNTGLQTVVCNANIAAMTNEPQPHISITLSPTQVDDVVRAAQQSRAPSVANLIADALSASPADESDGRPAGAGGAKARDEPAGEDAGPTGTRVRRPPPGGYMPIDSSDPRLSRSLLRGLSILTRFGPDGGPRGIVELAGDLGMSPSTAHRYAFTLVEVGLLERCPKTRKYRLPGT